MARANTNHWDPERTIRESGAPVVRDRRPFTPTEVGCYAVYGADDVLVDSELPKTRQSMLPPAIEDDGVPFSELPTRVGFVSSDLDETRRMNATTEPAPPPETLPMQPRQGAETVPELLVMPKLVPELAIAPTLRATPTPFASPIMPVTQFTPVAPAAPITLAPVAPAAPITLAPVTMPLAEATGDIVDLSLVVAKPPRRPATRAELVLVAMTSGAAAAMMLLAAYVSFEPDLSEVATALGRSEPHRLYRPHFPRFDAATLTLR